MGFRGMRFVVHVVLREVFYGKMEKLTVGWRRIVMGFRGMRFVVRVLLRDIFCCKLENLTVGCREF